MTKQEILKDIFEQVKKIMTTTLGDYNDDLLRDQVYKETVNILEHSSWSDQLANYHITCDRTNNTPCVIDNHDLKMTINLVGLGTPPTDHQLDFSVLDLIKKETLV